MKTIDPQVQQPVLKAIGWTDEQYSQFIYDMALAYLNAFIPHYPQVVEQITASKTFWSWWLGHWQLRDMEFMESIYNCDEGVDSRIEVYKSIHDPETLVRAIYLNGVVLQESYAKMIGEVTDEQHTKKMVAA